MPVISGMRWSAISRATGSPASASARSSRQAGRRPVGGDDARVVPEAPREVGLERSQHGRIGRDQEDDRVGGAASVTGSFPGHNPAPDSEVGAIEKSYCPLK